MDPVKIAGDNLEHERPGELVEDSIWVVVRGGRHVTQTCFTFFQVRTNTALKFFEIIMLFSEGFIQRPFPDTVTGPSPAPRDFLKGHQSFPKFTLHEYAFQII